MFQSSRCACGYSGVTRAHLLDWNTLGTANRAWFYSDDIHLQAGGGREGYADWLVTSVQP